MNILVLFGQRECSYPGEFAPEALEVITEYDDDENPEFMNNKLKEYKEQSLYTALEVVAISVPEDAIREILNPANEVIGKIIEQK